MRLNGFRKNVPKCQAATPSEEKGVPGRERQPYLLKKKKKKVAGLERNVYKGKGAYLEKICILLGMQGPDSQSFSSKEFLKDRLFVT